MQKQISINIGISCFQKILFLSVAQLTLFFTQAQYYEEKPEPEIGLGIKVVKGKIIYGPKSFYITDNSSIGLQSLVRYDAPVKIASLSPYQKRYISFVIESGFLFSKAKVFDSTFIDPNTNSITNDKSKNATYLPLYAGFYSRAKFSIGAEIFYWKGLGSRDIWGVKFLSVAYNATNFRLSCSGEWYTQTKITRYSGFLFSIDFLWKLFIED